MSYADVRHWYEEPDEPDMPNGHCYGTNTRKCGRFVKPGEFHCARCLAEFEADARDEVWFEQQVKEAHAAEEAHWTAYWQSPEGQAERAAAEQQAREYAAIRAEMAAAPMVAVELYDDLPF